MRNTNNKRNKMRNGYVSAALMTVLFVLATVTIISWTNKVRDFFSEDDSSDRWTPPPKYDF